MRFSARITTPGGQQRGYREEEFQTSDNSHANVVEIALDKILQHGEHLVGIRQIGHGAPPALVRATEEFTIDMTLERVEAFHRPFKIEVSNELGLGWGLVTTVTESDV